MTIMSKKIRRAGIVASADPINTYVEIMFGHEACPRRWADKKRMAWAMRGDWWFSLNARTIWHEAHGIITWDAAQRMNVRWGVGRR